MEPTSTKSPVKIATNVAFGSVQSGENQFALPSASPFKLEDGGFFGSGVVSTSGLGEGMGWPRIPGSRSVGVSSMCFGISGNGRSAAMAEPATANIRKRETARMRMTSRSMLQLSCDVTRPAATLIQFGRRAAEERERAIGMVRQDRDTTASCGGRLTVVATGAWTRGHWRFSPPLVPSGVWLELQVA